MPLGGFGIKGWQNCYRKSKVDLSAGDQKVYRTGKGLVYCQINWSVINFLPLRKQIWVYGGMATIWLKYVKLIKDILSIASLDN